MMGNGSSDDRAFDAMQAMLSHMHRKQDMQPLADAVRLHFGTGRSMYRANRHLWERAGLRRNDALLFSLMKDIARYSRLNAYGDHPRIGSLKEASPYLAANFIGLHVERFCMFCVNQRGCLKERVVLSEGIADTALFDLRRLLVETVRIHPLGGVIIAHNHPGGTLRPSQEDIDCTLEAIDALSALNAPLLDHVIVANDKVVSLRANGFIPEEQWLAQEPKHRILRGWIPAQEDSAPVRKQKKADNH